MLIRGAQDSQKFFLFPFLISSRLWILFLPGCDDSMFGSINFWTRSQKSRRKSFMPTWIAGTLSDFITFTFMPTTKKIGRNDTHSGKLVYHKNFSSWMLIINWKGNFPFVSHFTPFSSLFPFSWRTFSQRVTTEAEVVVLQVLMENFDWSWKIIRTFSNLLNFYSLFHLSSSAAVVGLRPSQVYLCLVILLSVLSPVTMTRPPAVSQSKCFPFPIARPVMPGSGSLKFVDFWLDPCV